MSVHQPLSYVSPEANAVPEAVGTAGETIREGWTVNDPRADHPREPSWYEFRLQGHLAPRWTAWLDEMTLTTHGDGTTRLRGPVVDQAALYGLLNKLRDIGLPLVSVQRVESGGTPHPSTPHLTLQGD